MRTSSLLLQHTSLALAAAALTLSALLAPRCSSDDTGAGGSGGAGGAGGSNVLGPGELCSEPATGTLSVRAQPSTIFLPPCTDQAACPSRKVKLILDPDVCSSHV